jgi:hypothetical protein
LPTQLCARVDRIDPDRRVIRSAVRLLCSASSSAEAGRPDKILQGRPVIKEPL